MLTGRHLESDVHSVFFRFQVRGGADALPDCLMRQHKEQNSDQERGMGICLSGPARGIDLSAIPQLLAAEGYLLVQAFYKTLYHKDNSLHTFVCFLFSRDAKESLINESEVAEYFEELCASHWTGLLYKNPFYRGGVKISGKHSLNLSVSGQKLIHTTSQEEIREPGLSAIPV